MKMRDRRPLDVLGGQVTVMSLDELLDALVLERPPDGPLLVGNHNLNSLALLQRDRAFRAFYDRCAFNFIDSMGTVMCLRAKGLPITGRDRLGVLDWIDPLCARAARDGLRIVHLGSKDPTMSRAAAVLRERHPGLDLVMISGYFDRTAGGAEDEQVLARIRDAAPVVLLVGMGMPIQEAWLLDRLDRLPACAVVTVGGVMGYLGGDRPLPPRWLGGVGLEWAYRLATEPRRLWRRYLIEPLIIVRPLWREARRARRRRTG